ncbi:MAG: SMC family ATPase [Bacteroidota bacterium]
MVPARLQLTNFLSYGESAPALDFAGLHVACLSGGNGQGKSALLDAMTWAIWGEARKSSDLRKPDEELLRVGTRSMEVDFSFHLADGEYRVVRSYQQSASGKTSKPGLEFQVRDGDGWRSLTAESVKATQAAIDARLGIDYETFINSTFLLQGRSDEFTKKKPGERKEILGKILALDRYERMAARANARWSRLRERVQALDAEAERLTAALEHEGTWTAEQAEVDALIAEVTAERDAAAKAEAEASARLATFGATAREAASLRAALADLDARTARLDAERTRIDARVAEADALITEADRIEGDHVRFETLRKRRTALDEKATLHRGIEQQLHALRLDLQKQTKDLEIQIEKAQSDLGRLDERIAEDERRLGERPQVERTLAAATEAAGEVAALAEVRTKREAMRSRIEAIDKQLASEKGVLEGQLGGVTKEGKRLAAELAEAATADTEALAVRVAEAEEAAAKRDALREEGVELSASVKTLEGHIATIAKDREAVLDKRRRLDDATDEACPTCGTPLTDAHRAEVAATYAAEIESLDHRQATDERALAEAVRRRDELRAEYARLKAIEASGTEAARALDTARAAAERRAEADARLAALRTEARALQRTLAEETFAQERRAERTTLADQLESTPFDEARFDALRKDAALRDHWAGELRKLDTLAESLDQRRTERTRKAADLNGLRERLASGAHSADTQAKIDSLDAQTRTLGFDPAEHETVGRDLEALAEGPASLARLLDARRGRADLAERLAASGEERRALAADAEAKRTALDALQGALAGRADTEAEKAAATSTREDAARRLADAQARRGALAERLERAAQDRKALKATKTETKEAKRERALYNHLRRAFGKNGIPSLIIEETLPEVEERANALLDRLGDGRTRVTLETLKDKKTGGGTRETLDIRITDSQGVARSYETFSGGEAFRVNFALRIALSQMLAERSGTRIRTLVIDEGFGTQDREGLQNLIGAIRAIQDDFDTILVITHLDELKAAFPVRIEVVKQPVTGSTFEIVGV